MRQKIGLLRKLVLVAFMVYVYSLVLLRRLKEGNRRSLQIEGETILIKQRT
jgi:hypothetical protein